MTQKWRSTALSIDNYDEDDVDDGDDNGDDIHLNVIKKL